MKCAKCNAMQNTSYTCIEMECVLGMQDDEDAREDGCSLTKKEVKERLERLPNDKLNECNAFFEFMDKEIAKNEALATAILDGLFRNNCICMKLPDGTLHECNTKSLVEHNSGKIRELYENLLNEDKK